MIRKIIVGKRVDERGESGRSYPVQNFGQRFFQEVNVELRLRMGPDIPVSQLSYVQNTGQIATTL